MASCTQRFRAVDQHGNSLSKSVSVKLKLRNGRIVASLYLQPGRTTSVSLTSGYYYKATSNSLGWQAASGAEFRACTSSAREFVFSEGGTGGTTQDRCDQYVRAEDQVNNELAAPYEVYEDYYGDWQLVLSGTTAADSVGDKITLNTGTRYKIVAGYMSGYDKPSDHTWTACQSRDIVLEYEDTSIVCDPGKRRCNGKNVEECNSEGTGWDFVKTCPNGCSGGKCISTVCTPGSLRCNGNNVERCKSDGSGWSFVKTCEHGCEGAGVCKSAPVAGAPIISSITWAPTSSNIRIASGGRHEYNGHTVKAVSISGDPRTVALSIDDGASFNRSEGETFAFGGRAWQVLSIACGPECDYINIAKTTISTRPVASEAVSFAATVAWNDDGENQTSRVVEWWCASQDSGCMSSSDLDAGWSLFATSNSGIIKHTFSDSTIKYIRAKARNRAGKISEWYGSNGCQPGFFFAPEAAPSGTTPGFKVTVRNADNDNLYIRSASYNSVVKKWELGGLVGKWVDVGNNEFLAVKPDTIGCDLFDPSPDTCGVKRLEEGKQYGVYRAKMNIMFIEPEDVYKLGSGITSVTVSQRYESLLEATICNFFGISGSECSMFVAELNDAVFVGNYVSAVTTGKDTAGNARELDIFDHLAMPFAVLGVLAPDIPIGSCISNGIKGLWRGGIAVAPSVVSKMKTLRVSVYTPYFTIESHSFIDGLSSLSPFDADAVMDKMVRGDFDGAVAEIREASGNQISNPAASFTAWNQFESDLQKSKAYVNVDWARAIDVLRNSVSGSPSKSGIDRELSKANILTSAKSIFTSAVNRVMGLSHSNKVNGIHNIASTCENAPRLIKSLNADQLKALRRTLEDEFGPERADKIVDDALGIVGDYVSKNHALLQKVIKNEHALTVRETTAILDVPETEKYLALISSFTPRDFDKLLNELKRGTGPEQALGNSMSTAVSVVGEFTSTQRYTEFIFIDRSLHSAAAALSDPPKISNAVVKLGDNIIESEAVVDVVGHVVDSELIRWEKTVRVSGSLDTMTESVIDASNGFRRMIRDEFNHLKEEVKREKMHLLLLFGLSLSGAVLATLYILTSGNAPETYDQAGVSAKMEKVYWKCFNANKAKLWDDLAANIDEYEDVINEAKEGLSNNAAALRRDKTYDEFSAIINDNEFNLRMFKAYLSGATGKHGTIRCTANLKGFEVQLDGTGDLRSDYNSKSVTFKNVDVGTHTVLFSKAGYKSCEKAVGVSENRTATATCIFVSDCKRPDPKIIVEQDNQDLHRFSFSGEDSSGTEITRWEWNLNGEKILYTQNASWRFWKAGEKEIQLTVTNDCGATSVMEKVTVGSCNKPVPDFTYTPDHIVDGQPVSFKGSATTDSDISRWTWDFGDGKKAYSKNTSHTFSIPAKRTVQLTVEDTCGTGTVTKEVIIDEGACDDWVTGAMITKDIVSPGVGDTVKFTAQANSDATINKYYWTLGDGTHKTSKDVSVKMRSRGYYELSVKITNVCGNSATAKLKIWVEEAGAQKTSVTIKFPKGGVVYW